MFFMSKEGESKIKLDWNYGYNRVLDFDDNISKNELNKKGFFIVASKHGKITNVCYDNILQLYDKFKYKFKTQNSRNIKYFTYAFHENESDSKEILSLLTNSLYYNSGLDNYRTKVELPNYIVFIPRLKHYRIYETTDMADALEVISKYEDIVKEKGIFDKLECKLFQNSPLKEYSIFVSTLSHLEHEYDLKKIFREEYSEIDLLDENQNIISEFGSIKDMEPSC